MLVDGGEEAAAGRGLAVVALGVVVEPRVVVFAGVVEQVREGHVDVVAGDELVLVVLQVATDLRPGIEHPVRHCVRPKKKERSSGRERDADVIGSGEGANP